MEGVKDQSLIEKFYEDEDNKNKLFIPDKNAELKERKVAAVGLMVWSGSPQCQFSACTSPWKKNKTCLKSVL